VSRTVVLDTGALLAFERRSYAMTVFVKATLATDAWILIPVGCIAESWRDGSKQALGARLMKLANELPDVDVGRAKRAGVLLGKVSQPRKTQTIDATVIEAALSNQPSLIVTADANDISSLLAAVPIHDVLL
jgi:hypothetical protein